jgi:hypothetical protein
MDVSAGHHAITRIAKLPQLGPELLETLERVGPPPSEAVMATIDVAFSATDDRE